MFDFSLTEEQELLVEQVEEFMKRGNYDDYITGHKTFNTYATVARYMMCVAREYEVEDKPKKDMSWYLIPLRDEAGNLTPGVTIHVLDKIGCHCMPTCEVYLDNVEVPESALVGARCNGFYQLLKNFETERLLTCVSNVG